MKNIKYLLYTLFIVFVIGVYPTSYYISNEEVTVTVVDKERITDKSGENVTSKYLVFTEDEVFENTDSFLYFKFNSSDIQGKLDIGKMYTLEVAGWRVPFMSMYRNIIEIKGDG